MLETPQSRLDAVADAEQAPASPTAAKARPPRPGVDPDPHAEESSAVPQLVTMKQVASLLAVSTRHIYRVMASGEFPKPVRIGGAIRFRAGDVAAYVEGQRG